MKKPANPFITSSYLTPKYFCDRESETAQLKNAIDNGNNITLFAGRRIGKTGLIKHLFYQLDKEKYLPIYADVYHASKVEDFVNILTSAISAALEQLNSKSKIKSITAALSSLRPKITVDPLTYLPSLELGVDNSSLAKESISALLEIAKKTKRQVVIAIDEFQQITSFEEKDFEAAMRSVVQSFPTIRFIFSGSQKHILLNMFSSKAKPFYRSTSMMQLPKLDATVYGDYIKAHLLDHKRSITDEALDFIFTKSQIQTYYVQLWMNFLFANFTSDIDLKTAKNSLVQLLESEEQQYFQLRKLLPNQQWKVLVAVALEGEIDSPTSKAFISKHRLGAASSTRQALLKLEDIGLVQSELLDIKEKPIYMMDDAFLQAWLRWKYG